MTLISDSFEKVLQKNFKPIDSIFIKVSEETMLDLQVKEQI